MKVVPIHISRIITIALLGLFTYCNQSVGQMVPSAENPNDLLLPPARTIDDTPDSIRLWKAISSEIDRVRGSNDTPRQFFMNTLQQSRQIGFHTGISVSALMVAQGYLRQSDYQKCIEMNALAVRYAPVNSYGYHIMSTAYNNIANAYSSLEKPYYAAYYYYRAAYVINTYLNGDRIEYIYCNLSNTLPAQFSLYYLERAETIARRKGNDSLLCITLSNKAVHLLTLDANDSNAHIALREALATSRKIAYRLFEYRSLVRLGALFLDQGNPEKAMEFLQQADQLSPEGDRDISNRNRDLQLFGKAYLELKDYDQATAYFRESLKIAEALKLQRQMSDTYYYLAKIAEDRGSFERALYYHKNYTQLKDSFMNETVAGNIQDLEVKYRTAEKDRELARKEQEIEKRNLLIGGIAGGGILLLAGSLFFYRHTQQKQKLIRQEQELLQLKALMEGEEIERSRIARGLHDGIMVNFSSVKMNLAAIMKRYPGTEQTGALQEVVSQLDDATRELRKSAHNLMPDMLLREGLTAAVRYFCNSMSRNAGLEIECNHFGPPPAIPPDGALMLYRTVQELLQNALKYAAATHIIVQIDNTGDLITITVEDNGKGFDPEILEDSEGMGLRNIRSRIRKLGGVMTIETSPDNGASIYIEIETVSLHSEKNTVHADNSSYRR